MIMEKLVGLSMLVTGTFAGLNGESETRRLHGDCTVYMTQTGCGWTSNYNCPGQTAGLKGQADMDGSDGYICCCEMQNWRPTTTLALGAAVATTSAAATQAPVAFISASTSQPPFAAPNPIAFQATATGQQVALNEIVKFTTERLKLGRDVSDNEGYEPSTGKFVAPETATYFFNFLIFTEETTSSHAFNYFYQGKDTKVGCYNLGDGSMPCAATWLAQLNRNDVVDVRMRTADKVTLKDLSSFNGVRVPFDNNGEYKKYAFFETKHPESVDMNEPAAVETAATAGVTLATLIPAPYKNSVFTAAEEGVYYFNFQIPATEGNVPESERYAFFKNNVQVNVGCDREAGKRDACSASWIDYLTTKGDTVTVKRIVNNTVGALFFDTPNLPDSAYFMGMNLPQATDESGTSFMVTSSGSGKALCTSFSTAATCVTPRCAWADNRCKDSTTHTTETLEWDTVLFAPRWSSWRNANHIWSAPVTGTYYLSYFIKSELEGDESIIFHRNGNPLAIGCYGYPPPVTAGKTRMCRATAILSLNKGDTVDLRSSVAPAKAIQNIGAFVVSEFIGFQIDKANEFGIVPDACFKHQYQYAPDIEVATASESKEHCQLKCLQREGCAFFSFNTENNFCHLSGKHSRPFKAHLVVSGPSICESFPGAASRLLESRELAGATTTDMWQKGIENGAVPGALIAGGLTVAGAGVGGLIATLMHNNGHHAKEVCHDTDNGALDAYGDACNYYVGNTKACGLYNDVDFTSQSMCCACKGIQAHRLFEVQETATPVSAALTWPSMFMIGGLLSLIAAAAYGAYNRTTGAESRRRATRVYSVTEDGESAEEMLEFEPSEEISSRKVFSGSRVAAAVSFLALCALIAFAFARHGNGQSSANAKATMSAAAVGRSLTSQELFESNQFASNLAAETLRAGHVPPQQAQTVQVQLATYLKSQMHDAVVQHSAGPDARSLQMTMSPKKQQLAYDLMAIMFDHRTQELGGRVLKSFNARPAGEDETVTHQRIQSEHHEMIKKYAKELFPQGLKGLQEVMNEDSALEREEEEAQDSARMERRLLPSAARARIGPIRSGWVVGTGVGGLAASVIGMILTALNILSGPGFHVHIPKWAIGMMSAIAAALGASSCLVQNWDRVQGIVNATFHPAALRSFGFNLGLQMPGWLKCALFTGISGLISVITFITEIVSSATKKAKKATR